MKKRFMTKGESLWRQAGLIAFWVFSEIPGVSPRTPVTFFVLETKKVTKESSRPQPAPGKITLRRSGTKTNIFRWAENRSFLRGESRGFLRPTHDLLRLFFSGIRLCRWCRLRRHLSLNV